ncbi:MAG: lysophospholipid acyltransferase family protein, partial [Candidatus Phosphoribacter sp.]
MTGLRLPALDTPLRTARTLAALGGLNAGAATGVAWGLLTRDRRRGRTVGAGLAARSSLALAGVKVDAVGLGNLPDGPAVYVVNHQCPLDPVIVATLIPGEFTYVAKKEMRFDPTSIVGRVLIEPAYIDRSDTAQAVETLNALVSRVRAGLSLVVFVEGTRTRTGELGSFRKGGFHVALQAGVPVVPVVLRNASDIMPRNARLVRPGRVDVAVLEPVRDLTRDRLDEQVVAVRDRFIAT